MMRTPKQTVGRMLFMVVVVALLSLPSLTNAQILSTAQYYPLALGASHTYRTMAGTEGATVTANNVIINGVATWEVSFTDGCKDYYSNDAQGVRWHQETCDGDTIRFSPPILYAPATANIGQNFSISGRVLVNGLDVGAYSASSRLVAFENVVVPAGSFETVRHQANISVSLADGSSFYVNDTNWLAYGFGLVKE